MKMALETEKKRSACLATKLKKVRMDKRELEESVNLGEAAPSFMQRNSTMHEDQRMGVGESSLIATVNNLSLASINIPECKPKENEDEIDRKTYESWMELLDASLQLIGITDEITKMNIFKVKAGSKLLEVLEGTSSSADSPDKVTAPFSNAVSRLKDYFGSREYNLMQRQKLRSITQKTGESDTNYVKRVVATAKLCDFEQQQLTETVADVIQLHALNVKVREAGRKLLRKGGTLINLVDKVRSYELDKANEEIFAKNHPQASAYTEVAAVSYGQLSGQPHRIDSHYRSQGTRGFNHGNSGYTRDWQNVRGRGSSRSHGVGRNAQPSGIPCWRCTSRFHQPSTCHALNKVCRNCQNIGHLERACRNMPAPPKRRNSEEVDGATKPKRIAAIIKEDDENEKDDKIVSE